MAFDVTITAVEQRTGMSDRGPYSYTELTYDFRGQNKSMKIFPTAFKKYPNLKGQLDLLKTGQIVGIELVKNDKGFNEISNIITNPIATNVPVGLSTGISLSNIAKPYKSDNEIGLQVGNALTNAVNSLGSKATVAQIKSRALDIIRLGNELKEMIKSGKLDDDSNDIEEQKKQTQAQLSDDEDLPF